MRLLLSMMIFMSLAHASVGVKGKLVSPSTCSQEAMVWLALDKENYKDKLLLMHTLVPAGGTFQFYLKPGDYELRASDSLGCEFLTKLKVKNSVSQVTIKMVKK